MEVIIIIYKGFVWEYYQYFTIYEVLDKKSLKNAQPATRAHGFKVYWEQVCWYQRQEKKARAIS